MVPAEVGNAEGVWPEVNIRSQRRCPTGCWPYEPEAGRTARLMNETEETSESVSFSKGLYLRETNEVVLDLKC